MLHARQTKDKAAHEYADQMMSRHRNLLTDARIRKDTFLARRAAARRDEAHRRLGTNLAESEYYNFGRHTKAHERDKRSDHRRLAGSPHATSTTQSADKLAMERFSDEINSRMAEVRSWRRKMLSARRTQDKAAHEYADQMVSRHRSLLTDARIRKDTFLARRAAAKRDEAHRRLGANLNETKCYGPARPGNTQETRNRSQFRIQFRRSSSVSPGVPPATCAEQDYESYQFSRDLVRGTSELISLTAVCVLKTK